MDTRRLSLALLIFLLPGAALADRHKIGFRGAYADAKRSDLHGLQFSTDVPLLGTWKDGVSAAARPVGTLAAVIELSMVSGTHENELLAQFTGLLGVRYSLNRLFGSHVQPFVQAQIGFARERQDDVRRDLRALALGGGVHIPLGSTAEGAHPALGLCLQYDQYGIGSDSTTWYGQISVGVVLQVPKIH